MIELVSHWITHYGYLGLYTLLMLGIVGLPIPDETMLVFSGYLIHKHQMSFPITMATAFLGSATGMTISYTIGRTLGLYLLHRYGRYVFITPERLELARQWYERRGKWSLAIGYFMPGVRHLTAYIGGATKLSARVFCLFAYGGALFWVTTFILAGYFGGRGWQNLSSRLQLYLLIGSGALLAGIVMTLLIRKRIKGFGKK